MKSITFCRFTVGEAGGTQSVTVLAPEVLHFITGADVATPFSGTAPLRRASLTAALLHALETALGEVYETAPIGSMVVPFPENPEVSNEQLARGLPRRGRL